MNKKLMEAEYISARDGENLPEAEQVSRSMSFIKLLLSDNSQEIIEYHYELLKDRTYKELYYDIRAAFRKRPNCDQFLFGKFSTEIDPITQADVLHILGGLRSHYALPVARKFVDSNDCYKREVALYVIGWVGGKDDIPLLREHMLHEENPHLRITAASAHRQIGWRLPELKNELLASLKEGFEKEKDDEVIAWIIVMIESIAVKRLGLREDKEEPDILHGDVQKAKVKTAKFLAELNL